VGRIPLQTGHPYGVFGPLRTPAVARKREALRINQFLSTVSPKHVGNDKR
jgi:hypothetical protein